MSGIRKIEEAGGGEPDGPFGLDHADALYQKSDMASRDPRPALVYDWQAFPPPPNGWKFTRQAMQKLHDEGYIDYPRHADGTYDFTQKLRLKRYR